ncbi:MAG: T9SS type A sorting domain-containing protein [Bacteroidetes bacterium]|nr:T9SS type A sorting domain-containing protein [Bacteroidota bacterium]
MRKYIKNIILFSSCLIISNLTIGQSTLNLVNGSKLTIASGTAFQNNDLNIGTGSQLSNRGNLTVNGVLANFAGTTGLILKADDSGYGSLMHYTPLVPATVEQYLVSERWHLVSPPIQQATIGIYENIYLKEWSEPNTAWTYLITPLTIPMNMHEGYAAWTSDDLIGTTTVVFEGNLRAGNTGYANLEFSAGTSQEGWNLVGNPYPSAVEWNASWFLNDVGGWAIVYENGTYKGWNPWMPTGEKSWNGKNDGFIAPTQGFWIRATGSNPYVSVPQTARSHNAINFLKETEITDQQSLHITVSANAFSDETTILFLEDGTVGFDGLYDLEKHMNVAESPNIFSIPFAEKKFAINVLPSDWIENTTPAVIPLGFVIEPVSDCFLEVSGLDKFNSMQPIYLEDLKLGTMHNLFNDNTYGFVASADDDPNRFLLHFGQPATTPENLETACNIYAYGHYVYIKLPDGQSATAVIHDMLGKRVITKKLKINMEKIWINNGGAYIVNVYTGNIAKTQKIFIDF